MDNKELRKEGIPIMWQVVDANVKEIARNRRAAELIYDINNEEFDAKLNEICEKYYNKYLNMDHAAMALDTMGELIKSFYSGR